MSLVATPPVSPDLPPARDPLNPFPFYAYMRATAPVVFDPAQALWHVYGYADVQRVLSDWAVFSSGSRRGQGRAEGENPFAASLINTDPPRHRALRALVTQAFTPRTVAALAPRITAIVEGLLDAVPADRPLDAIGDLAYPLPMIVIAELLGIPATARDEFKRWSTAVITAVNTTSTGSPAAGELRAMLVYFQDLLAARRRDPQDDLISHLLAVQIDGVYLTQSELLGFCVLLLIAGNETTTNLLGNALLCLDEQPGLWDRLRHDPPLVPPLLEEVLRYRSPVQSMFRGTVQPATLSGQVIPAGQTVVAWIGSANRDAAQFPAADQFDIDREPNRHIAFGHGIHYCLGAPLARLEAKIALEILLTRYGAIQRRRAEPLTAIPSMLVYGVQQLLLDCTPLPREQPA